MVKAIKGTNLELFDMNECDDLDATVDGGDVLYTGFWSKIKTSHNKSNGKSNDLNFKVQFD